MSKGIYTYFDREEGRIIYVGKDSHIDKKSRHNVHMAKSHYNDQQINRVLQNNPERYSYGVVIEGEFDDCTLNALEEYYIWTYNTFRPESGYGHNYTVGGDGAMSGDNNPKYWLGKKNHKFSERYHGENHWHTGKTGDKAVRFNPIMKVRVEEGKTPNAKSRYIVTPVCNKKQKKISSVNLSTFIKRFKDFVLSDKNTSGYQGLEFPDGKIFKFK